MNTTTYAINVASSKTAHGKVHSIRHVTKFVRDLRQVGRYNGVLRYREQKQKDRFLKILRCLNNGVMSEKYVIIPLIHHYILRVKVCNATFNYISVIAAWRSVLWVI
jgi:hypothetical protein